MPEQPPDNFARFLRLARDAPVTRFALDATGRARPASRFSVRREDGRLVFDTTTIHAITKDEWENFGRIYARNVRDKDLVEHERSEWEAQTKERKEAWQKAKEEAARAAKAESAGGVS